MLLVSYDFPAEHMNHLRRTNPIESTFVAVRHRGSDRRAVYPARSRSRWTSKWSSAPRKIGGVSMATTNIGIEVIAKPTGRQPKPLSPDRLCVTENRR